MASQPTRLSGEPTSVVVMDWIYEMDAVFKSYDSGDQWKTIFATTQLKTQVLCWWNQLANVMLKGEARKISWEKFLMQLMEEYCSERHLLEIANEFQNLKKG